jgi:NitT/TauT family transport system ATP-binding protein
MEALLDVRGIRKYLGEGPSRQEILGDLSFGARPGEFLSVVGPSGCGKTTLLMCLAGLYGVDAGAVRFEDRTVDAPPPGLSVVFQDYSRSLLPWKNNLDNVVFGMKRLAAGAEEKRRRAMELLAAVGLGGYEKHFPWQVSGGMQRVAIARGLAAQSRLLLLDEPLAAVDAQTRAEMQDLLLELAQRFQQTCVLVTHDVEEAVYVADRVIVLSRRPTRVLADLPVACPKPRDQLTTREHPEFLRLRHEVITMIRSMRQH